MPLTPGTCLGAYEILSALGAGGMGEVYRARDTKLGRDVALKILPESFTHDPERVARFRREAQMLASLNHPHIAQIHGLDDARGTQFLILELVDGESLDKRIARGPMASEDALGIARQLAEALEAAHDKGIIHRDLKPANVALTKTGVVKVLDFGLAKALDSAPDPGLSLSPTFTNPAMTRVGIVLGTAPYMSPEQACGKAVDKGSDIWAFGCVLFEMLTGKRAFNGDDVTETIAAIIRGEPEWSHLPANTPDAIRRLLRRCLEKDRRQRLADIRDARLEIEDARRESTSTSSGTRGRTMWRERFIWGAAVLLLAAIATATFARRSVAVPLKETHVDIATPPTTDLVSIAMSPDGEKIVFVASSEGRPKLWLRSILTGSARPLNGTDGASFPFWSPDSRSIGFFANGNVDRIDEDGGSRRVLAPAVVGTGGTWNSDHVIVYTPFPDAPVLRVSDTGGTPVPLPGSRPGRLGERFPQFLPDGRHFLYTVADTASRGVYVGTIDGPERKRLFDADAAAVFVPPAHVLFLKARTLFEQRFNPTSLTLEENAVPLADGVALDPVGAAAVSGSSNGSVIYRVGSVNREGQLAWIDRSGRPIGEPLPSVSSSDVHISADGRQVALTRSVDGETGVWLLDLASGRTRRFTTDPMPAIIPIWGPDDRIVFGRLDGTLFKLYEKATRGVEKESLLFGSDHHMVPSDWSRDGRFLLFQRMDPVNGWTDLWALTMDGSGKAFPVVQGTSGNTGGQFSPDGNWVAFQSSETGEPEIYLQHFPTPASRTVVSKGGGVQPRFRADGKELFYVAPDGRLMVVPEPLRVLPDNQTLAPGTPVPLFRTHMISTLGGHRYIVTPDGQRFLMNEFIERADAPITLVLNRARSK